MSSFPTPPPTTDDVYLDHGEQCYDRLSFGLTSNTPVGHHVRYVSAQDTASPDNQPVPNVVGAYIVSITILAPIEAEYSARPLGTSVVPGDQIRGSVLTGVWYGGSSDRETVYYAALNVQRRIHVDREQGPESGTIDVDFAH